MERVTRHQAKLRAKKRLFNLPGLPLELRIKIYDEFLPSKIYLKKRYMGVGGNTPVAPIFTLLSLNRQSRSETFDRIRVKNPIFSLSVHHAPYAFPILQNQNIMTRRLELRNIEFDRRSFNRSGIPSEKTADAIEMFKDNWPDHQIEELSLICSLDAQSGPLWTPRTLESEFAPLGRFKMVLICWHWRGHYDRRNYAQSKAVMKRLRKALRKDII